jgi:acetyl esterase/lipase
MSEKDFGEPMPVSGGGIAPSGAEPRDIPLLQFIQKLTGPVLTHLPAPLLKLVLRGMRQERPPKAIGARVEATQSSHDGVSVTWLAHHDHPAGVVVYLPGGLYVAGPVAPQWKWLAEIQRRTGLAAATVCYRKPPEHPHPAALDDAVAVIASLHRSGELTEGRWVLAGDSAGGHLALAACQRLRDTGGPMPAGLLLTAPLVDMEFAHPQTAAAIKADPTSTQATFWWGFKLYANGTPLDDPTLSPINAPLNGLPPVHLNIGTRDLFLFDVRRLRDELQHAGVELAYIEQQDAKHAYPLRTHTPEAQWAIHDQVRWLQDMIARTTPQLEC